MSNLIGIMQGRLSPSLMGMQQYFPDETWEMEYGLAAELGFDSIEWVVDSQSFEHNPIFENKGIQRIKALQSRFDISNLTVCADTLKETSFIMGNSQLPLSTARILEKLIMGSTEIGAKSLVIPLVEKNSLKKLQKDIQRYDWRKALKPMLDIAESQNLKLAIESDLPAVELKNWIDSINHPSIGVNFDMGNSVALGYSIQDEISELGSYICGVHVKDRKVGGPNVSLGYGDVDFELALQSLNKVSYSGPLILETFRDRSYMSYATDNMRFLLTKLKKVNKRIS
tara:strand:+ start:3647 stop:4498 length:852 start_codon:yes stop_codon:yes gene_type:complete